ncbi:hypothetical protein TMEN_2581 [Trichophyton mentagrophytes]|uniref:ER membrane protein complex subunit 10 n=2 Tax=Trichophyton TaxID=5550 RepID=A0A059J0E5_TRIIM|nr:hypothetical protein TEQG_04184 [Trichophyton equinum CBS 127.97]EZF29258.1 hypothetical protein H101_07066 [Trichophyton interdigitale H6]KAG5202736.1 hypothetical protein GY631_7441 [Trichophyton interdigitale]KDB21320.1 hypothetical protein H109_06745 [Trichophyton interdigitale MR816]GBF60175.1 hypothetical protein TMEN_2581 [Trichophyton mentagrophytes]
MRLLSVLLAATSVASAAAMLQAELFYQPVTASSKPVELAQISYDPATLRSKVISYSPPEPSGPDTADDLVHIGTSPQSSSSAGVLASRALLQSSPASSHPPPTFSLYLDPKDRVYHVGVSSSSPLTSTGGAGSHPNQAGKPLQMRVQLIRSRPAAMPQLNKPIARKADDADDEQAEVPLMNSLLQKYWWLLPIVFLLAVGGGGS